ncbi:MAG: hypothetical protein ABSA46_09625 [Thermodesulfovibrionales bacterium]|jgi:hypothetical protein
MKKCPACTTSRSHTKKFDKLYTTIFHELKKRNVSSVDDIEELAMALSVLAADSLDIDIYE